MGKVSKDKRDIYYRKAKEEGWRARSAFKLLHINEKFNIFNGVKKVVDLCAAPGGWSQVLSKQLYQRNKDELDSQLLDSASSSADTSGENGASYSGNKEVKIVAVDLQPMAPLPGVIQIQGDITKHTTAQEIIRHFEGEKADLVVCDGAPDVTGLHCMDVYLQSQLLLGALHIACTVMQEGATFVAKIFRSNESDFLLQNQLLILFKSVTITKPRSSRNSSIEAFVVCREYNPPTGFDPTLIASYLENPNVNFERAEGINKLVIPFLVCGDVPHDADANYPLNINKDQQYTYLAPVQLPIEPPYKDACSSSSHSSGSSSSHSSGSSSSHSSGSNIKTKKTLLPPQKRERLSKLHTHLKAFQENSDWQSMKLSDLFKKTVPAEETTYRAPYRREDSQSEPKISSTEEGASESSQSEEQEQLYREKEMEAKKVTEDYKQFMDAYKKNPEKFIDNDVTWIKGFTDHIESQLSTEEAPEEENLQDAENLNRRQGDPIYDELLTCVRNMEHCCESEKQLIRHLIDTTL